MRDKECYRSFFPKERFLVKLSQPAPSWMLDQIERDLKPFDHISQEALQATFERGAIFDRYRVIDNLLYKYAPKGQKFSSRDNEFERALKTLLLYAKLPDVDFLYCPKDGIPEPYMEQDYYFANPQAPVFARARLESAPHIILIPDQFSLSENWYQTSQEILSLNRQIPWGEKLPLAMWRGSLTDIGIPNTGIFVPGFRSCPRYRICILDREWVDGGLLGSECPQMDQLLLQDGVMKAGASKKEHLLFKYLPVLDGHMCTYPGYQWRLLSNSLTLKQESDQEQWFYSALQPYVHYIPIANDMSDLIDKIRWAQSHEKEVLQIIQNAREFSENHLLTEDDYLYLYLALKYYSSHQKVDRKMDSSWKCIHYRKRQDLLKSCRKLYQSQ